MTYVKNNKFLKFVSLFEIVNKINYYTYKELK